MRTNRALLVTGIGVSLAFLPGKAHAVGWGNWWTVYEGYWPLPHYVYSPRDASGANCPNAEAASFINNASRLGVTVQ